ncbi:hypothetical protein BSKO_05920 [Bryopsis sp. KO-2023]|nr:hypothetical protein BSKO_05920 [Bryopsis sp. KO-2023]
MDRPLPAPQHAPLRHRPVKRGLYELYGSLFSGAFLDQEIVGDVTGVIHRNTHRVPMEVTMLKVRPEKRIRYSLLASRGAAATKNVTST